VSNPYMPEVEPLTASHVTAAREVASDSGEIAVILPDRRVISVAASDHVGNEKATQINAILGNQTPCNVTVIGMTEQPEPEQNLLDRLLNRSSDKLDDNEALAEAIPFFKYVQDVAGLGNNVIVFEGQNLSVGCDNADAVIVDGGLIPHLGSEWLDTVKSVMTNQPAKVLVFSREGRVQSM
jgi:hypothetical protein